MDIPIIIAVMYALSWLREVGEMFEVKNEPTEAPIKLIGKKY